MSWCDTSCSTSSKSTLTMMNTNILVILLTLFVHSTQAYIGVIRQSNGTDIELRTWYKDKNQCGETTVLSTNNELIVFEGEQRCGYICQWIGGKPYSSYTTSAGGALTCKKDKDIRQGNITYFYCFDKTSIKIWWQSLNKNSLFVDKMGQCFFQC